MPIIRVFVFLTSASLILVQRSQIAPPYLIKTRIGAYINGNSCELFVTLDLTSSLNGENYIKFLILKHLNIV